MGRKIAVDWLNVSWYLGKIIANENAIKKPVTKKEYAIKETITFFTSIFWKENTLHEVKETSDLSVENIVFSNAVGKELSTLLLKTFWKKIWK